MTQYIDIGGSDGAVAVRGTFNIEDGASHLKIGDVALTPTAAQFNLLAQGVAAGYKVARGTAAVTTSLEVATGLATVVNYVVSLIDDPNITATSATAAASTTAGNILIKTWQPTATNNVTPAAATKTNVQVAWVAIGT